MRISDWSSDVCSSDLVVVFNVIAQHGYDGLLLATLMAGVLLIVAGYSGLGSLVRFIPQPVVTGFTAGIAVIIASSQVKDFLGLSMKTVPADFIPKWSAYFSALGRSEEHTSELQSLMRFSYAVFCLKTIHKTSHFTDLSVFISTCLNYI